MSTIGDRIKGVIENEGITLKEASIRADVPYRSLQNYISNKQSPGMAFFARFRETFSTDLNWLITGDKTSSFEFFNKDMPPALIDESILDWIEISFQEKGCEYPEAMYLSKIYNKIRSTIKSYDMQKEHELLNDLIETETEYFINLMQSFNKMSDSKAPKVPTTQDNEKNISSETQELVDKSQRHKNLESKKAANFQSTQNFNAEVGQVAGRDIVNKDKGDS